MEKEFKADSWDGISKKEKIAIITGASKGIGRACAKKLGREGIKVIANYNKSRNEAEALKSELLKEGVEIDIFKADITKKEEIEKMVEYTLKKYGKIDILINNAGISQIKPFADLSNDDIDNMLDTNLKSVFYVTRCVIDNMIHNKSGCIINMSSVWGITGSSCEVTYSATKAGVIGMTKALAKEMGLSNIRVNTIAPGATYTDMNNELTEEELKELENEIPLKRMADPIDIANSAYMLICNNYITGQVITVDGGWIN